MFIIQYTDRQISKEVSFNFPDLIVISSHLVTLTGSLPSASTPDPHLPSTQMSSVGRAGKVLSRRLKFCNHEEVPLYAYGH